MALKTKPYVKLRIYKGSEKLTNSKGVVVNENQLVSLQWNTLEWSNYFKYISGAGFGIIEVEKCYDEAGDKEIETPEEITNFVANVFKTTEKELTPEQKQILDLQKQNEEMSKKMDAILKANKAPKAPKETKPSEDNTNQTPPSDEVVEKK